MKIIFSLCGNKNKASSRIRGFWIAEVLEQNNVPCKLCWNQSKLSLLRFVLEIPFHDVVIFQKTYSRYHRWLMTWANFLGKRTYLDIDDAPSRTNSKTTLKNSEAMMRQCTGVFAGSRALWQHAQEKGANAHLIPSGIRLENYQQKGQPDNLEEICIGWIGNGAHYKEDLLTILPGPLRSLAVEFKIRFKLVGACGLEELHSSFDAIPNLKTKIVDSIDWSDPSAVSRELQSFDIGVYPLLHNEFNSFKCGFKAIEYMATGIPVVATPLTANADIVDAGKEGLFADSREEWTDVLRDLLQSAELRSRLGIAGRQKAESSLNTKKIAEDIKNIINSTAGGASASSNQ